MELRSPIHVKCKTFNKATTKLFRLGSKIALAAEVCVYAPSALDVLHFI